MNANEWLRSKLERRIKEMRSAAAKCRGAYTKGPLFDAANALGDAYDDAANVFVRAWNKTLSSDDFPKWGKPEGGK